LGFVSNISAQSGMLLRDESICLAKLFMQGEQASSMNRGAIAAIMESHSRYEERQLLSVLETLELDADPGRVLGPL
jgi:hypothetical protein